MSLIILSMLTNNDATVENALEIFESNKNSKTKYWGFKDVGISEENAIVLVQAMKRAGKITIYEPLVEDEKESLKAAQFAIDHEFDYLIGNVFHQSVSDLVKNSPVKYFPTCGKRSGTPRMLYGTVDSIVEDAKRIMHCGADGVCLSVYRYVDGEPEDMAKRFVKELDAPFMITGSINNDHRLDFMKELQPFAFTIGSALFDDSSFGGNNTIAEKLDYAVDYLGQDCQ